MSKTPSKNAGRPKTKGPLRNFKLRGNRDDFLVGEKERTGRDMTLILEASLDFFKSLKPAERDAALTKILTEAA